jgi:hypothetical protein
MDGKSCARVLVIAGFTRLVIAGFTRIHAAAATDRGAFL